MWTYGTVAADVEAQSASAERRILECILTIDCTLMHTRIRLCGCD